MADNSHGYSIGGHDITTDQSVTRLVMGQGLDIAKCIAISRVCSTCKLCTCMALHSGKPLIKLANFMELLGTQLSKLWQWVPAFKVVAGFFCVEAWLYIPEAKCC